VKTFFTTFGLPLREILEKSPSVPPWKKFFRRPWWRIYNDKTAIHLQFGKCLLLVMLQSTSKTNYYTCVNESKSNLVYTFYCNTRQRPALPRPAFFLFQAELGRNHHGPCWKILAFEWLQLCFSKWHIREYSVSFCVRFCIQASSWQSFLRDQLCCAGRAGLALNILNWADREDSWPTQAFIAQWAASFEDYYYSKALHFVMAQTHDHLLSHNDFMVSEEFALGV